MAALISISVVRVVVSASMPRDTSRLGLILAGEANVLVSCWVWELRVSVSSCNVSCPSLLRTNVAICYTYHRHHYMVFLKWPMQPKPWNRVLSLNSCNLLQSAGAILPSSLACNNKSHLNTSFVYIAILHKAYFFQPLCTQAIVGFINPPLGSAVVSLSCAVW